MIRFIIPAALMLLITSPAHAQACYDATGGPCTAEQLDQFNQQQDDQEQQRYQQQQDQTNTLQMQSQLNHLEANQ